MSQRYPKRNAAFARHRADAACPHAKQTWRGLYIDALRGWLDDPQTAGWAKGRPQGLGRKRREKASSQVASAVARHTGRECVPEGKPGRYLVGPYEIWRTEYAIIIAVALSPRNLHEDILDAWRKTLNGKLWLVQFDRGLSKVMVACPFTSLDDGAIAAILEALDNGVEEADELLSLFESNPAVAETWLVWYAAGPERPEDGR